MEINSKTALYCIFGNPVSHSLSPIIHNSAFQSLDINAVYLAFSPDNFENAINSIKSLNIKGASITIPFKIDAMKFVDEIDPLAKKIGSVNTLVNIKGKIKGYNTDGMGALKALQKSDIEINNSNVLILGNGGSARAIAFTLLENNASVTIAGRNQKKISALSSDLKKNHDRVSELLLNDLTGSIIEEFDIIINTTPIGMDPERDKIPIKKDLLTPDHVVFDIVYSPDMTALLQAAKNKGCKIIRGIDMLIYQGIEQFYLWTGKEAPYKKIYNELSNKIK